MRYKLLASDYDNTLVPFGEKRPRPAVEAAVRRLQAAGGRFVLSTGRAWPAIRTPGQLGAIRFDYAITCNGAYVVDAAGAPVYQCPLLPEEMYALVDFCEACCSSTSRTATTPTAAMRGCAAATSGWAAPAWPVWTARTRTAT